VSNRSYPDGIDCVWLASDRDGHLGAFVTGGVGPIPIQALNCEDALIEDIEKFICNLRNASTARLLVSIKRPDDFIELAERGVFVYDWSDVHRTARESIHAYELVATPVSPITVNMLPVKLASVAKALKFGDVAFADKQPLDVRAHMKCGDKVTPCQQGRENDGIGL
jgi:hypothetical protein